MTALTGRQRACFMLLNPGKSASARRGHTARLKAAGLRMGATFSTREEAQAAAEKATYALGAAVLVVEGVLV